MGSAGCGRGGVCPDDAQNIADRGLSGRGPVGRGEEARPSEPLAYGALRPAAAARALLVAAALPPRRCGPLGGAAGGGRLFRLDAPAPAVFPRAGLPDRKPPRPGPLGRAHGAAGRAAPAFDAGGLLPVGPAAARGRPAGLGRPRRPRGGVSTRRAGHPRRRAADPFHLPQAGDRQAGAARPEPVDPGRQPLFDALALPGRAG